MIIGIAGTLGAGKGTVVEYLKTKGFTHYSVSGRLAEIVKERGEIANRKNLSALADELALAHTGGILEVMHKQAQADGVTDYILESIHREAEAEYVQSIDGVILAVDASPRVRYDRTTVRQEGDKDNVTYAEFIESINREEKGHGDGTPNINAVLMIANHVIANNGTMEELEQKVEQWLNTVG